MALLLIAAECREPSPVWRTAPRSPTTTSARECIQPSTIYPKTNASRVPPPPDSPTDESSSTPAPCAPATAGPSADTAIRGHTVRTWPTSYPCAGGRGGVGYNADERTNQVVAYTDAGWATIGWHLPEANYQPVITTEDADLYVMGGLCRRLRPPPHRPAPPTPALTRSGLSHFSPTVRLRSSDNMTQFRPRRPSGHLLALLALLLVAAECRDPRPWGFSTSLLDVEADVVIEVAPVEDVPGLENGATFTYDDLPPGRRPNVRDLPDDQCVEGTATARLADGREFVYTGPMCPGDRWSISRHSD